MSADKPEKCGRRGQDRKTPAQSGERAVGRSKEDKEVEETGRSAGSEPKLLDRVRGQMRVRQMSWATEKAYIGWIRRYILFHGKRHPAEMGAKQISAFLTHLASEERVSASTQNQALCALMFLYKNVLGTDVGELEDLIWAKRRRRIPVVLTRDEVREILCRVRGVPWLVLTLLYGTGMRLKECLQVRVQHIDFQRNEITIRDGKGGKDRRTMLPEVVKPALRSHLAAGLAMSVIRQPVILTSPALGGRRSDTDLTG